MGHSAAMELDYAAYETLFNTGDDAALVARFFAPDTRMISSNGVREGAVLSRPGLLFAEVDMDFHATKHRPDFPFGELQPGDSVTVKFFVTYRLDEDSKIAELRSMTWPPGYGVSKLPPLGSHPSQLAAARSLLVTGTARFEPPRNPGMAWPGV